MGRAATAAMISFHQRGLRASHQAKGVARISRMTVVVAASRMVVQMTSSITGSGSPAYRTS